MKSGWLSIGIIITFLLSACDSSSDKTRLQKAKEIYLSAPEQAEKLLDSINVRALNRKKRSDYTLLKIHVQYLLKHNILPSRNLPRLAEYYRVKGENAKANWACFYTGVMLASRNDYAQASICFAEAEENALKNQDSCLLFKVYYNMGKLYALKHDRQASKESFHKALAHYRVPDHMQEKNINYEVGNCYLSTGHPSEARTYYKQAEANAIKDQDSLEVAKLMYNIGLSYLNTGNKSNAVRYLHQSLDYNKDLEFEAQYNICLANIYLNAGQTDSAAYYLEHIPRQDLSTYALLASYYMSHSLLEEKKGNYKVALANLKDHIRYTDSIAAERTEKRIDNIISRHNKRKWQGEAHILIHQRTLLTMSIIILALVFILVVTYAIIIIRKRKNKYLEAYQTIEILQDTCRANNEQEDKFKRILLNQLEISKKLAAISSYPRKDHPSFLKMYNQMLGPDSTQLNWEELYLSINCIYNHFQEKLMQKFPDLDEQEMQLCCLLKGGFNNEEIAFLIGKGVSSIYKMKTTIRKKLALEERADIIDGITDVV